MSRTSYPYFIEKKPIFRQKTLLLHPIYNN